MRMAAQHQIPRMNIQHCLAIRIVG
jgi:hypothetical protein